MPTYEYYCGCGKKWENFHLMSKRYEEVCSCGKPAKIQLSGGVVSIYPTLVLEDLHPDGPVTVNSRKQLEMECAKQGVNMTRHITKKKAKRGVFLCH